MIFQILYLSKLNFHMIKKQFVSKKIRIPSKHQFIAKQCPFMSPISFTPQKVIKNSSLDANIQKYKRQPFKNLCKLKNLKRHHNRLKSVQDFVKDSQNKKNVQSQKNTPIKTSFFQSINQQQNYITMPKCSTKFFNDKFKYIYRIGLGGLGKVWKVIDHTTQEQYAMKSISKGKVIMSDSVQSILNQRLILSQIDHPFIVNMKQSFQDQKNLYLTMDYLRGGDLRYHLCYKDNFTEAQTKFILSCLIMSLEYIHSKNLIHRDIKPQNIIFQDKGYVRITDFGIAKYCKNGNKLSQKGQPSGTPGYMAPQIICKQSQSFSSDYFSLGVVIYELMFRKRPYLGANRQQIRNNMIKNDIKIRNQDIPSGWSIDSINFIQQLLQKNPKKRLGANGIYELKQHKWMKNIKWQRLQQKKITPPFIPYIVCQSRKYLKQIDIYIKMEQEKAVKNANFLQLDQYQHLFQMYDYDKRQQMKKKNNRMNRRVNQQYSQKLVKDQR